MSSQNCHKIEEIAKKDTKNVTKNFTLFDK